MLLTGRHDYRLRASTIAGNSKAVKRRFVIYLSALLAFLLPLEAGFAAAVCSPAATPLASILVMADGADEDSAGMDCCTIDCTAICVPLCQSFPLAGGAVMIDNNGSSAANQPFGPHFPLVPLGGPEPPPPRLPR